MEKKHVIRLINEEISNFDYLNIDELEKEDSVDGLLKSKEFQTKLIHDLMTSFTNNQIFKDKEIIQQDSNVEDLEPDSTQKLNVTYIVDFIYNYMGKDMPLSVIIEGNDLWQDLRITSDPGDWYTPPSGEANLDFDWTDFQVKVMYDGEIEVEMDWLYKNKELFRKFLDYFIGDLVRV